jgi:hypothetical protein
MNILDLDRETTILDAVPVIATPIVSCALSLESALFE